jgi:hypothetical protein
LIDIRDQKAKIFEIDDESNVNILNVEEYLFSIHRFVYNFYIFIEFQFLMSFVIDSSSKVIEMTKKKMIRNKMFRNSQRRSYLLRQLNQSFIRWVSSMTTRQIRSQNSKSCKTFLKKTLNSASFELVNMWEYVFV